MPTINLRICGCRPRPRYDVEHERPWREPIMESAKPHRQEIGNDQINADTAFAVSIKFFFCGEAIRQADLDNLAIPVLNTLFEVNNPRTPEELTGALFDDVDDKNVCRLILEKVKVPSEAEEGADISISWNGE